jgi:putative endonuclease
MADDLEAGRAGERTAERHLVRRGWRILARNWRGAGGELDLVASRRDVLAVCEVKTRGGSEALDEVLTAAQRARIARAAAAFVARRPELGGHAVRFDLIGVRGRGWLRRVRHVPAAWEPPAAGYSKSRSRG